MRITDFIGEATEYDNFSFSKLRERYKSWTGNSMNEKIIESFGIKDSQGHLPDYCERSVFEALVNALIHRDYLIYGSEVHVDMFDDRLVIYSPGGMPDGTQIQERDIADVPSTRRNPILADIFARLGYMERQGSGLNKIQNAYKNAVNYQPGMEPAFRSNRAEFTVKLLNLNFKTTNDDTLNGALNGTLKDNEKIVMEILRNNPQITLTELAECVLFSKRTVQRKCNKLKKRLIAWIYILYYPKSRRWEYGKRR